jgi:hypothetical protein
MNRILSVNRLQPAWFATVCVALLGLMSFFYPAAWAEDATFASLAEEARILRTGTFVSQAAPLAGAVTTLSADAAVKLYKEKIPDNGDGFLRVFPIRGKQYYPVRVFFADGDGAAFAEIHFSVADFDYAAAGVDGSTLPAEAQALAGVEIGRMHAVANVAAVGLTWTGEHGVEMTPLNAATVPAPGPVFRPWIDRAVETTGTPERTPELRKLFLRRQNDAKWKILGVFDGERVCGAFEAEYAPVTAALRISQRVYLKADLPAKANAGMGAGSRVADIGGFSDRVVFFTAAGDRDVRTPAPPMVPGVLLAAQPGACPALALEDSSGVRAGLAWAYRSADVAVEPFIVGYPSDDPTERNLISGLRAIAAVTASETPLSFDCVAVAYLAETASADLNPPTAALSASPTAGAAPLQTAFCPVSTGLVLPYVVLDFGDGASADAREDAGVSHTYATEGVFTARLTVKDHLGRVVEAAQKITVAASLTIKRFAVRVNLVKENRDSLALSGFASLPEDLTAADGLEVNVELFSGAIRRTFKTDRRGRGAVADGKFKILLNRPGAKPNSRAGTFSLNLRKASLREAFVAEDLDLENDGTVAVNVEVLLATVGNYRRREAPLVLKIKGEKSISGKNPKGQ